VSFKRPNGTHAGTVPLGYDVLPSTEAFIAAEARAHECAKGKALDLMLEELQVLREMAKDWVRPRTTKQDSTQQRLGFDVPTQ
jgi:hypothetical protein